MDTPACPTTTFHADPWGFTARKAVRVLVELPGKFDDNPVKAIADFGTALTAWSLLLERSIEATEHQAQQAQKKAKNQL
jgi:hypothetical protein